MKKYYNEFSNDTFDSGISNDHQQNKIVFLPYKSDLNTSERTPLLARTLEKNYSIFGINDKYGHNAFDQAKSKILRIPFLILQQVNLMLRLLSICNRNKVKLIFCTEDIFYVFPALVIAKICRVNVIWDSHGSLPIREEESWLKQLYQKIFLKIESISAKSVSFLITVSNYDKNEYVKKGVSSEKIECIPVCIQTDNIDRLGSKISENGLIQLNGQKSILFFGDLRYPPNQVAFNFINNQLAPHLIKKHPDVIINIAGRGKISSSQAPNVKLLGFVQDIYNEIKENEICIAPIWNGKGAITKVLDMMAMKKIIITTEFVAQGIPELKTHDAALIAKNPYEFIEKTVFAIENYASLIDMSNRAKHIIEMKYNWEKYEPTLFHITNRYIL